MWSILYNKQDKNGNITEICLEKPNRKEYDVIKLRRKGLFVGVYEPGDYIDFDDTDDILLFKKLYFGTLKKLFKEKREKVIPIEYSEHIDSIMENYISEIFKK